MISVGDARNFIDLHRPDWGTEVVPVAEANYCILHSEIRAKFTQPSMPTSSMDGYAFRKIDIDQTLTVIGESRAGQPFSGAISKGEAVRIFTGAHLPHGADQIEIQEYAIRDGNHLTFSKTSTSRNYIRPEGSFFRKGDCLFKSGQRVTPAIISTLASANISSVSVKKKPTIAILRCGDELRPLGAILENGQIIDSNGPFLVSLLSTWGYVAIDLGIVGDDPAAIREKVSNCEAEIIIPVGGASVGNYDYMKSAFLGAGFKPIFDTVAIKPGKPVWLSSKPGQVVLGFPGNPHSVFVCSFIFLSYLLQRSSRWETYPLTTAVDGNGARERYIPAMLDVKHGVTPLKSRAGQPSSMDKANILIRRMPFADPGVAGENVECLRILV